MNVYFLGMCLSMVVYLIISMVVSKRIRNIDDYYVAGRRAPVLLVAGSLIASYVGTGMFTGDAQMAYLGFFSTEASSGVATTAGYVLGAILFGRFLRRTEALTIPEFFGKRFHSKAIQNLASVISVVTMTIYLISVSQGIAALMHGVTGVDAKVCMILSMIVFTFVAAVSGSSGVLITDTLMAGLFTSMAVIAAIYIGHRAGGWSFAIQTLTRNPETSQYFALGGPAGVIYDTPFENMLWAFFATIVWMGVCTVSPWQASRYLMAKDEGTVIRSALPAMLGISTIHFVVVMGASFVKLIKPDLEDSSQVMIWAAMNILPKALGVLLLTGVLAAGISSATTFLSQIGTTVACDLIGSRTKRPILAGRIVMIGFSALVIVFNLVNPPSIYWIMMLGGAIIASAWLPTAIAAVYSPRLTKAGAFAGMLLGFLSCFGVKIYTSITGAALPIWMDPNFIGILVNIAATIVVSLATKVTEEEKQEREALFVMPQKEKNAADVGRTYQWVKGCIAASAFLALAMIVLWAVPYMLV